MRKPKWCRVCEDYVPNIGDHIKQHSLGENSDARNRKQYTGSFESEKKDDYLVCVVHQRKVPCSVKGCNGMAFGYMRKSFMMSCMKGFALNDIGGKKYGKMFPPYFPVSTDDNCWHGILIDMKDRTVVIKGATIHLRF